jgi:hypothetical protein
LGLERGSLSLMSITEELLEWKSSGSGSRKPRLKAVGIRCADNATPSIRKKLALSLPTSVGRSVDIVRLRTKTKEFSFSLSFSLSLSLSLSRSLSIYIYQLRHETQRIVRFDVNRMLPYPSTSRKFAAGYLTIFMCNFSFTSSSNHNLPASQEQFIRQRRIKMWNLYRSKNNFHICPLHHTYLRNYASVMAIFIEIKRRPQHFVWIYNIKFHQNMSSSSRIETWRRDRPPHLSSCATNVY